MLATPPWVDVEMTSVSRRRFLRTGAAALGVGAAGCVSFGDDDESGPAGTRLNSLQVGNHDRRHRTVYVLLLEGGEPTYWEAMEADPYDAGENRLGGGEFQNYPTEAGEYVLYAWRDDQPRPEWRRFDLREHDADCVNVFVMVGAQDDRTGLVRILPSAGCPA